MDSYKTPIMKTPVLVASLKDMGFNITENDFRKPEPKRWREFYAKMFHDLTCISIEEAIQLICQMSHIRVDHPELIDEGFSQMAFTLCMQRVLCSCGYEKFSVKDVIEPNSKVLVRMGSVFINACRHNNARRQYFEDLLGEIEYSRGEFDKILNKNNDMKEQLLKLKETNQHREAEIIQHKEEEERLKAQLEELQREPFLRDTEEIKHNIAEKTALKEKFKQNLIQVQQECEKLSNKIVPSPERFKQDQDRLRNKVQLLKAQKDTKRKKLMQDKALEDLAENKRIACEKLVKVVKEIQTDVQMAREEKEEMENHVEKANELREHHFSLLAQKEDFEENISVRQTQKQKILSKTDLNKQCGEQELAAGIQQCAILERQLETSHAELSAISKRRLEVKENRRLGDQGYKDRKASLEAELVTVHEAMDELQYLLLNGLEDVKKLMQ